MKLDSKSGLCILLVLLIFAGLFTPQQSYAAPKYDGSKTYLTIWFDHACSDQTLAVDAMLKDGIKGALLVRSGVVGMPNYMTWQQLNYYSAKGFEMTDHSITHPKITDYTSQARLAQEILLSRAINLNHGLKIAGYMSPYDKITSASAALINQHYKWTVIPSVTQNTLISIKNNGKMYGFSIPTLQHFGVGVPPGPPLNNFTAVKTQIDYAIKNHTWLCLSFHQLDHSKIEYHTEPAVFMQILSYIKQKSDNNELVVVTPSEGL